MYYAILSEKPSLFGKIIFSFLRIFPILSSVQHMLEKVLFAWESGDEAENFTNLSVYGYLYQGSEEEYFHQAFKVYYGN